MTDVQLILSAQQGDMKAFEELVCRYDRQVLNIARSFKNNDDDAKDIYQEVFMRVYKGLKNFEFKSEFSTWLFRIATNVCITHQSRRRGHESLDREFDYEDDKSTVADFIAGESRTDSSTIGADIMAHINKAVEKLPPQQKMVFVLKYFQEYKIREIAQIMNCKEGAVKKYLFIATNKLRDHLKNVF